MRLLHTLQIWRATSGSADDYNQPSQTFAAISTVRGLIQPKSGDELAQLSDAGPVRGKYRVFIPQPVDVTEGDQLLHLETSEVYEPTFVANAGGVGHHYEIDAERVWP